MKIRVTLLFLVAYCFADLVTIHLQRFKSQRKLDLENGISRNNASIQSQGRYRGESDGTIALNNYYDAEYVGQIQVGSGQQHFTVLFDTGSPDLWLPSINCTQDACVNHNRFNCTASSTCLQLNQQYGIHYGGGSAVGTWIQDSVTLGGLTVQQQKFGYITSEPGDEFRYVIFDGILGMSYPFLIHQPVFNNLMSENLVLPVFSFFLNRNANDQSQPGGVLTLGGIPSKYYTGPITYLNVVNVGKNIWWTVSIDSVTDSNNNTYGNSTKCILDTGTTLILGPVTAIDNIHENLNASQDMYGRYYWNCSTISSLPDVIFTMSGNEFPLSSRFYSEAYSNGLCYSSFDATGGRGLGWILGDVFIGAYFTVFNFGTNQIGLATSTSQPANNG